MRRGRSKSRSVAGMDQYSLFRTDDARDALMVEPDCLNFLPDKRMYYLKPGEGIYTGQSGGVSVSPIDPHPGQSVYKPGS
jgi:hypothetical protein